MARHPGNPGFGFWEINMKLTTTVFVISCALITHYALAEEDVQALLAQLSSPDEKAKQQAILKLYALGPKLRDSRAALKSASESKDFTTKFLAIQLLEACDTDIPGLVKQLGVAENEKRREAAQKLFMAGPMGREATAALITALSDSDAQLRILAARALGSVNPDPKVAVPVLVAFLQNKEKGDVKSALVALGCLGADALDAVPVILPLMKGAFAEDAGRALARIGYCDFSGLIAQLKEADPKARTAALQILAQFGVRAKDAVPSVIAALKDTDRGVSFIAVGTLGAIGGESADARNALIGLLKSTDGYLQAQSAQALLAMTYSGKPPVEAIPALVAALRSGNRDPTTNAANALGRMGPDAVPALIAASKETNPELRKLAIFALGFSASKSNEALNAIMAAMKDPDPGMRSQAAYSIQTGNVRLKSVVAPLATLVADPDGDVRYGAVESLKRFGPDAIDALPALLKALSDPELKVRTSASLAIGAIGPEVVPKVLPLMKDPNPETRRFALSTFHGFRQIPEVLAVALQAMKDPDPNVRCTAVTVLMELGVSVPEVVPALAAGARDDADPEVRQACEIALTTIAPDAQATQNVLQPTPGEQWTPTVLRGHSAKVNALALSLDGKMVATGDDKGEVRLWETETGKCLTTRPGPAEPKGVPGIMSLSFSPEGKRLAAADYLKTGRILEIPSFKQAAEGPLTTGIQKLIYSPNGDRLVGFGDRTTTLLDIENLKEIAQLGPHEHVEDLVFSPDGQSVLLMHGRPSTYDLKTGKGAEKLAWKIDDFIGYGTYSPDGKKLLCRSLDQAMIVDLKSGLPTVTLSGQEGLKLVRFSPDGVRAVTVAFDKGAKLWNVGTGALEQTLFIPGVDFTDAVFFPNGKRLATLSWDGAIRVWSVESGKCLATLTKPKYEHDSDLSITPDGMRITATSKSNEIVVWTRQP